MPRFNTLTDIGTATDNADVLPIADTSANQDKKVTALNLKNFVLANKAIGGAAATDITVNNAAQDLSNKKLILPKVNSTTTTSVTSEDLEKLHAVTVSAVQINHLSGISSNVQTQLSERALTSALLLRPVYGILSFTAAAATHTLTEVTIRAAIGLGTNIRVQGMVMVQVHQIGATFNTVLNPSNVKVYVASGVLSSIEITGLSAFTNYSVMVLGYYAAASHGN